VIATHIVLLYLTTKKPVVSQTLLLQWLPTPHAVDVYLFKEWKGKSMDYRKLVDCPSRMTGKSEVEKTLVIHIIPQSLKYLNSITMATVIKNTFINIIP
jgi:hypothetical protein